MLSFDSCGGILTGGGTSLNRIQPICTQSPAFGVAAGRFWVVVVDGETGWAWGSQRLQYPLIKEYP